MTTRAWRILGLVSLAVPVLVGQQGGVAGPLVAGPSPHAKSTPMSAPKATGMDVPGGIRLQLVNLRFWVLTYDIKS